MKFVANWRAGRAMVHQVSKRDKKEMARALYEKAIAGGTDNSDALSAYTLMLLREGSIERAMEVSSQARTTARKPKQLMNARMNRGLALWKAGRLDDAIKIYEHVFQETRFGTVYGTLGFLYIAKGDETGDYGKALAFNTEAVDYDGDDAVVLDNLAQTHMRLGQWDEAEQGFRKALEKRPEQFDSLVCLARCALRKGGVGEARELIAKAMERPISHLNTVERSVAEEMDEEIRRVETAKNGK